MPWPVVLFLFSALLPAQTSPGRQRVAEPPDLYEDCYAARKLKTAELDFRPPVLEDLDLSGTLLAGIDLAGKTIRRVDLSRAALVNVNFRERTWWTGG